jgi:Uma2 family endonuclease
MRSTIPKELVAVTYEAAAQEYLRSLPLEHFMEATAQAKQRKITLESFDLIHAQRPDIQLFNELLVLYPVPGQRRPKPVVPDNMVTLSPEPIEADGSFNVPLQPVGPFMMLEYVSKHNKRKDYEDNFDRYERDLKVPYYLLFYPDTQDLTLYRHTGKRYVAVPANEHGRYPVPELELEVGLLDGWVRFWFRGQLLPLPADLQRDLDAARHRADQEKHRADQEKHRADQEKHRADQEKHRAEELQQRVAQEEAARQAAEQELARLRDLVARRGTPTPEEPGAPPGAGPP